MTESKQPRVKTIKNVHLRKKKPDKNVVWIDSKKEKEGRSFNASEERILMVTMKRRRDETWGRVSRMQVEFLYHQSLRYRGNGNILSIYLSNSCEFKLCCFFYSTNSRTIHQYEDIRMSSRKELRFGRSYTLEVEIMRGVENASGSKF